ncbi:MAG: flippase-like domain-containing protein [Erysipelotrichales bacterium]|nr:flippase-like domain-containing protein [Erysipelotrichales bacterium]
MHSREEEIRKTQEIIINDNIINTAIAESELEEKTKKTNKSNLFGLIFVLVNIILVVILGFTSFNNSDAGDVTFGEMFKTWMSGNNAIFWFIAMGLGLLALIAESLKFFVMIRKTTHKNKPWLSLKTAIMGKYYDNITPLGSGGQPFQIFYLSKGGVPGAESMYLPTASFFLNQFAFLILCIVAFIFKSGLISDQPVFLIMAYIGAAFSIVLPTLIFVISFMPKLRAKIIKLCVRVSFKLKFVKNKGAATRKANKLVNDYKRSLFVLAKSKLTLLIITFLSFVYQLALCSIPYFVIRACGVTVNYFDSLCICIFVYAAISFIPTPGNSGAAEVSFSILFTMLHGLAGVSSYWAMAYWRFCCYFLGVLLGMCFIVGGMIKSNRARKKELAIEKEKLESKKSVQ